LSNTAFVDDLIDCVDDVLGCRDEIGAIKDLVYISSQTWSGGAPGRGTLAEVLTDVLPTPHIVDLRHNSRIIAAGKSSKGDILLKNISRKTFATESEVDGSSNNKAKEVFYKIGENYYTVVSVKKKYATWDILLRKNSVKWVLLRLI